MAEQRDARMIVVGSFGDPPLKGMILGSTPNKLLHLSERPVLVVPPPYVAAPRLPNYVGGAWVEVDGVETLADVDPASGATVAEVPLSGAAEVDAAVAAARAAQPGWRRVSAAAAGAGDPRPARGAAGAAGGAGGAGQRRHG